MFHSKQSSIVSFDRAIAVADVTLIGLIGRTDRASSSMRDANQLDPGCVQTFRGVFVTNAHTASRERHRITVALMLRYWATGSGWLACSCGPKCKNL